MAIRFSFDAQRTKLPRSYRRRVAFRNSHIRMEVAQYANYERWWVLGWDMTVQWGAFDKARPEWSYRAAAKRST